MGSKLDTKYFTCITFLGLTASNKFIKISEYGKVAGIDQLFFISRFIRSF